MRSCPILTSSLRQPDNFWQTELFIHSINFHLDNSFLYTISIDQQRMWLSITPDCSVWQVGEAGGVMGPGPGYIYWFPVLSPRIRYRERTVQWTGSEWSPHLVTGDMITAPLHYSTLPRPYILHTAEDCSPDWILRPENKIIFQKCPWAVLARPRLQENGATLYKG